MNQIQKRFHELKVRSQYISSPAQKTKKKEKEKIHWHLCLNASILICSNQICFLV